MSFLTNPDGSRLVVYRGEHGSYAGKAFHTRSATLYFSDVEAANYYAMHPNNRNEFAEQPRVIPAYLKMSKPFINTPLDSFIELSEVEQKLGTAEAKRIACKFAYWVKATDNWQFTINPDEHWHGVAEYLYHNKDGLKHLFFQAYPFFADEREVNRLKRQGYDGAIHAGTGMATANRTEYCVFNHKQAVPIFTA